MDTNRSTVLIAVEAPAQWTKNRLDVLNSLSLFVPNTYPAPRPAFIFQPHTPQEKSAANLTENIVLCLEEAQRARAQHAADFCAYVAFGSARRTEHGEELAMGIVALVGSYGTLSVGMVGPFIDALSPEEEDSLGKDIYSRLKYDSDCDVPFDPGKLSESVEWAVEGLIDYGSTRH